MIRRTYMCPECAHMFRVELTQAEVDDPAPDCPRCAVSLQQEFLPVAIRGKAGQNRDAATRMAETIAREDYSVADMNIDKYNDAKVRYKEPPAPPSNWIGPELGMLQAGLREGRATREQFGSGLEVLQGNLASGKQPDLIEVSKRRSTRVW